MNVTERQSAPRTVPVSLGKVLAEPPAATRGLRRLLNLKQWPILRMLLTGHLLLPVSLLLFTIFGGLVCILLLLSRAAGMDYLLLMLLVLVSLAGLSLVMLLTSLRTQLLQPLAALEKTVTQVCQGEPMLSPAQLKKGVLSGMARGIDSLSEELTDVYEDMQVSVARQSSRLAQKTTSLQVLYDVAAGINQSEDLDELLLEYLRVFKHMVSGRSATVHLVLPEEKVRLVGCIDQADHLYREEELRPIKLCQCGVTLSPGDILCMHDLVECSSRNGQRMYGPDEIERVSVSLWYHGDVLGFYHLYVEKPGIYDGPEDVLDILNTIGGHLGMAVAKQRSDAEAMRLSIVEERTTLAHELHDSLAQTLASLRFQVRMLEETLQKWQYSQEAQQEAARIHSGLDEAHNELRELINSFRAPLDQRGLVPALERLAERFRQETNIPTFFQSDCRKSMLDSNEEMQALRIVQESLANIRKHAQAHTVRILLRSRANGSYLLLVEDDGIGFEESTPIGNPGEHIGLSIMAERARRVKGELNIESEPGEGTRVELLLRGKQKQK